MRTSVKYLCRLVSLLLGVLLFSALAHTPARAQVGSTAEAAGITFETLSPQDLDAIQQQTGYRVGVYVADVKAGSAGAAAGIKMRDIILIIGEKGVDTAQAAAAAVNAATGTVEVMAFTSTDEGFAAATYSLEVSGATAPGGAASSGPTASGAVSIGWQLQALDKEALDKIEKATGHRVGVGVTQVATNSPAGQAGLKANDILLVVGKTGVDSPEAVDKALAGQSGSVEILAMRPAQDKFEPVQCTIALPAASASPGGAIGGAISSAGVAQGDPVNAYCDMMDFTRSEAWGRKVSTSAADRQKLAAALQEAMAQMDAQTLGAIQQIPAAWAEIQKNWAAASEQKRAQQREYWRKQLLLPNQILPPLENCETFNNNSGSVSFQYPPDWIQAQTQDEDTQYLYLGPPGTETSWDQVVNASVSPAGVLFAIGPATEEMKATSGYLEAARLIAQQFVTAGAPDFEEIGELNLGEEGAIITLRGHFPGQREEKFFWVGTTRFAAGQFFAGRFGGPSSQADALIPAFTNMLATLQLNPPGGGGGGGAGDEGAAAVDYYAARAGNLAISGGW